MTLKNDREPIKFNIYIYIYIYIYILFLKYKFGKWNISKMIMDPKLTFGLLRILLIRVEV